MPILTSHGCPVHRNHGYMAILYFDHLKISLPDILKEMGDDEVALRAKLAEFRACNYCQRLMGEFLRGASSCRLRKPTKEERQSADAMLSALKGKERYCRIEFLFFEGIDAAGTRRWTAVAPVWKLANGCSLHWTGTALLLEHPQG